MEQAVNDSEQQQSLWRPIQVYVLAAICLVIGLPVGYLLRGSAPATTTEPVAQSAPAGMPQSASAPGGMSKANMPSMEDMKRMADKKAEPLLEQLKKDPNNAQLLNKAGIMYRSAHQFKEAQEYFARSLKADPKNADVRTDMAACMYYNGDVDGALAELEKALTYDPKHAGALMNIGIIKYRAKNDVDGAVASWEKLLKLNPDFPQKEIVQKMITEAKQAPTQTAKSAG
jgi:cytochrome c-type biogenesis protein CcmH/NrfG